MDTTLEMRKALLDEILDRSRGLSARFRVSPRAITPYCHSAPVNDISLVLQFQILKFYKMMNSPSVAIACLLLHLVLRTPSSLPITAVK